MRIGYFDLIYVGCAYGMPRVRRCRLSCPLDFLHHAVTLRNFGRKLLPYPGCRCPRQEPPTACGGCAIVCGKSLFYWHYSPHVRPMR
jgi:hypothetical protein